MEEKIIDILEKDRTTEKLLNVYNILDWFYKNKSDVIRHVCETNDFNIHDFDDRLKMSFATPTVWSYNDDFYIKMEIIEFKNPPPGNLSLYLSPFKFTIEFYKYLCFRIKDFPYLWEHFRALLIISRGKIVFDRLKGNEEEISFEHLYTGSYIPQDELDYDLVDPNKLKETKIFNIMDY